MSSNIHTIIVPTPFLVGPVNIYLLNGPEPALIDAAPHTVEAWTALCHGLATHGHALADIRHLVITHAHPDHYGMAARIVAESGAQVYSHRYNLDRLATADSAMRRSEDWMAELLRQAGVPPRDLEDMRQDFDDSANYVQPVAVDTVLDDNDTLRLGQDQWKVVHTPGHARGHICLFHSPSGRLFSGDHLIRNISSNPIVEPPLPGETERPHTLSQYIRSLKKVAAMNVTEAYPGHGAPISDTRGLIARRLEFHRRRAEQIAALLDDGSKTPYQIAQTLFPTLRGMNLFLAVSETIGHLDILEEEGRVRCAMEGGRIIYTAKE